MANAHLVKKGFKLSTIDSGEDGGLKKEEGKKRVDALQKELYELQELLYAAGSHSLLIVLQGLDTSGKEGAIGAISAGTNVHGVSVAPFKGPTPYELAHDFLWRVHAQTPAKGMIGIFNRSHYEDVLIVRVHEWVPKEVWQKRYEHIRNFESLLLDANTIILKFFLHISKEEQEQRLLDREKDPTKAWKLNVDDWKERERWDDYQKAYQDALVETSTNGAPWFVVPSDHKWYRNLLILEKVVETLRPMRDGWMKGLAATGKAAQKEIDAFRKSAPAGES